MRYKVVLSRRAEADIDSIYLYIAKKSYPSTALSFVTDIRDECETLSTLPQRGTLHPRLGHGIRTMGFRHSVTVAFRVEGETVTVVRVFYRGRNVQAHLKRESI